MKKLRKSGMTLIELLGVITLMAVFASCVAPVFMDARQKVLNVSNTSQQQADTRVSLTGGIAER